MPTTTFYTGPMCSLADLLTWEQIVRFHSLTLDQPAQNKTRRQCPLL